MLSPVEEGFPNALPGESGLAFQNIAGIKWSSYIPADGSGEYINAQSSREDDGGIAVYWTTNQIALEAVARCLPQNFEGLKAKISSPAAEAVEVEGPQILEQLKKVPNAWHVVIKNSEENAGMTYVNSPMEEFAEITVWSADFNPDGSDAFGDIQEAVAATGSPEIEPMWGLTCVNGCCPL